MNYRKAKLKKILKLLPPMGSKDTILDVGCEYGPVTAFLHDKGYNITGIDINSKVIAEAKKKYPGVKFKVVKQKVGSLDYMNFGKHKVYILWGVFEYLFDPERFLQKIKKELKPGAVVIFTSPNICSFSKRVRSILGVNPNRDRECFKTYNVTQIKRLIKKVGFKNVQITTLYMDCLKGICFPTPRKLSTDIIIRIQK